MTRLKETWTVGQGVWASCRGGWRAALVTRVGFKKIEVFFPPSGGYGMRRSEDLRPRDRSLDGADNPPRSAERAVGEDPPITPRETPSKPSNGAIPTRGGGLGGGWAVTDNVRLGKEEW